MKPGKTGIAHREPGRDLGRETLRFLQGLVRELFVACLGVYLVSVIMDKVSKGFVSDFLDPNILLALALAAGAAALSIGRAEDEKSGKNGRLAAWSGICAAPVIGVAGAVLIYAASPAARPGRLLSALVGGTTVLFLTRLLSSVGKSGYGNGEHAGEG